MVLGLLWQIIRIGLFNQITLEHCPGLTTLLGEDEKIDDLMKLSPEAILLRWVNYHLERAGKILHYSKRRFLISYRTFHYVFLLVKIEYRRSSKHCQKRDC